MRFGILGPLEVGVAGERVEVRGRRRRALLVRLLVSANEQVPAQRLLADVWDDAAHDRVMSTLASHVQMLREVIGRDRILWRDGGYVLRIGAGELDLFEFEADVAGGHRAIDRGDVSFGAESLGRALATWRGPALSDVSGSGWGDREAARLEEAPADRARVAVGGPVGPRSASRRRRHCRGGRR
ncbi:MAG: BTAD domain-containing putative transcriptional regulator [Ilumatobacteraceae bacterium]